MVGHLFQNCDTIYVGFLSRILVKISYIWAFIPCIRPFSTHIRVQNSRIYAAFKGPYIRGLKCAYTRLRNRYARFKNSYVYPGMKSAFLRKVFIYDAMKSTFFKKCKHGGIVKIPWLNCGLPSLGYLQLLCYNRTVRNFYSSFN